MARSLQEIISQLRANIANPAVATTLIQTEDLAVLCNAAEANRQAMLDDILDSPADQAQRALMKHILENTMVAPAPDNDDQH